MAEVAATINKSKKSKKKTAVKLATFSQCQNFIAARDIQPGELIFSEYALISGPSWLEMKLGGEDIYDNGETEPLEFVEDFKRICLGCYKKVVTNYICSKCGWPVCSKACENVKEHAENECKIFTNHGIHPFPSHLRNPCDYKLISLLRLLLSKDKSQLLLAQSSSNSKLLQFFEDKYFNTKSTIFIRVDCKFPKFQLDEIKHMAGLLELHKLDETLFPALHKITRRNAMFIFNKASYVMHSCSPNTYWTIENEYFPLDGDVDDGRQDIRYMFRLHASTIIKSGTPIRMNYIETAHGTFERNRILQKFYSFSCFCERCLDPTEFGTFLSSIKCPNCQKGYLMPILQVNDNKKYVDEDEDDDHDDESSYYYKCLDGCQQQGCGHIITEMEGFLILKNIENDMRKLIQNVRNHIKNDTKEHIIPLFEATLCKYKEIHPNHWITLKLEYIYAEKFLWESMPKKYTKDAEVLLPIVNRMIEVCQHLLFYISLIHPGENTTKGRLLFMYSFAISVLVEKAFAEKDLQELQIRIKQLKESITESKTILERHPKSSPEFQMGKNLFITDEVKNISAELDEYFVINNTIAT